MVWILSVLLLVSIYVIFNLLKKLEKIELANEEYSDWIDQLYTSITSILNDIQILDDKKIFESDDEVGSVFSQISETIKKLEELKQ